ncbi:MAG: ABC transporter permease subunit [Lachnospiraceae bacterium]|nr:ABC transporter permease subunit [Lachnospiraceae bacterium]MCM1230818.1 ABC transporter permease subunit [Ruminococcus flavefaciens]
MNVFFNILGYEFKKILCKKRTAILIVLVVLLGAVSVFGTIIGNYYYTDESGNEIAVSRYEEEMTDRRYSEELSGRVIDADLIMEAVEAYRQVPINSSTRYTDTKEYRNIARKYSEIYGIVSNTFGLKNIQDFQNLTYEQAERFDEVRIANREYAIENSEISENMKNYWKKCLDRSPEKLTYEYCGGYYRFVMIMYTTAIMAGAVIAIMIAGIFSGEYTSKMDSLILTLKHGKGLVIGAKLLAAFTVSAVLIILLTVISYAEAMTVWGTDGADASLLMLRNIYPYNITVGQSALLYSLCVLMACLMFSAITSLLSAFFKTPFNTIVIMAFLLIVPMFISLPDELPVWLYTIENLLPTNMMAYWGAMYELQYEIFGIIIPPYVFIPAFCAVILCICIAGTFRIFKKHQVR